MELPHFQSPTSPTILFLKDPYPQGTTSSVSRISNSLAMYHASEHFNALAFIPPMHSTTLAVSPTSSPPFQPSKLISCLAVKTLFSEGGGNGNGSLALYPQSCIACAAFLSDMRLVSNISSLALETTTSSASASSSSSSSSSASDPAAMIQPIHLLEDFASTKASHYLGNAETVSIPLSPLASRSHSLGITPLTLSSPVASNALIHDLSGISLLSMKSPVAAFGFNNQGTNKTLSFKSYISSKSDATVTHLQSSLLHTRNALPCSRPMAVLTPVFFADPPDWKTESINASDIPPILNDLFFPLPQRASDNLAITVCIPFYSEDGYALRRGLEAIVCQRADFRRYFSHCYPEVIKKQGGLPELHVLAIADGWRREGGNSGAYIVSDGMFAELAAIFGDSLDVDELVRLLEMPENVSCDFANDDDIESNSVKAPKGVLIQFALNKTLAPVWLDVSWAQSMECRSQDISGLAALAMAEAIKKNSITTDDDTSRALVYSADKCSADKEQPIFFSLYIKRHNAKKHHSHRLFLEAFAPVYRIRSQSLTTCNNDSKLISGAKYSFLTDCGTLYSPFMLAELYHYMESHPFCAASTGHQRIMNRQDQADPLAIDAEPFAQSFLRQVQSFDFEAGLCIFNGMHALIGYLPVVPGPCAFFRSSALSHQRIELLREIISSPPHLDGIIQGNLKIAEDRILSFILLMNLSSSNNGLSAKSHVRGPSSAWSTDWVLSTCFYFESEETLKELVMQRRRWLNGTTAGNLWLLSHKILKQDLSRGSLMAFKVLILSCFQMLVFGITALLPGLMIVVGAVSISGLTLMISIVFPLLLVDANDANNKAQAVFLTISFVSLFSHAGFARFGPSNYEHSIWLFRSVLNAFVTTMVVLTSLALSAFVAFAPTLLEKNTGEQSFRYIIATLLTSAFVATSPFFLTYMHSRKSFYRSISTFPGYLLFSSTILSDFYMYSLARADDLTWGTKSTLGGSRKAQGNGTDAAQARLVAAGRSRALAAFGSSDDGNPIESEANALVSDVRSKMKEQRQLLKKSAKAKEKMYRITNVIAIVQMISCVALVAINIAMEKIIVGYLLYAGVILGVISISIQALSFTYFVKRALFGKGAGSFLERTFQIINFLGWLALLFCVCTVLMSEILTDLNWKGAAILFVIIYAGLIICAFLRSCTSATVTLAARATRPYDKNSQVPISDPLSDIFSITHLSAATDFADAFLLKAETRINDALAADAHLRASMLVDVISCIQNEVDSMLSLDLGSSTKSTSNEGKFLFLPPREFTKVSSKLASGIVNLTSFAMQMALLLESAEEAAAAQTVLLVNVITRVMSEANALDVDQQRLVVIQDSISDACATLQAVVLDLGVSLDVASSLCLLMTQEAGKVITQFEGKAMMIKMAEEEKEEGEGGGEAVDEKEKMGTDIETTVVLVSRPSSSPLSSLDINPPVEKKEKEKVI